ncbi:MAG: 1-acyl-sn-glycerol-3-phosphate acyltransferase, partial [Bryobacteraceae bacterium]
ATWEGGRLQARASDWLATGDLGTLDEGGNLKFRGRKKEVIVTAAGLNIYPEDLEAALLRQPHIQAAAVVESMGPKGGAPLAALVLRAGGDAASSVRDANSELAEYQQIRRWMIWPDPDFPRTSSGKILRREVAAALQGIPREGGAPAGALEGLIAKVTGEGIGPLPDSALLSEDFHLDSLGRVELQSQLETRFGITVDDSAYQEIRTLGELKSLMASPASQVPHEEHIFPLWPWSRAQRAIRSMFIEVKMRPLVWLLAKPRVIRELDEPLTQPVLIVANHVTTYDVPLILYALPGKVRRRVAVAMAGEMLLGWRKARGLIGPIQYLLVTGLFNVFPLPQAANFRKSFAHAARAMDAGFHVLVFPEGRRTPDGLLHTFQGGAGMLWRELRTPALPVYLG